MRICINCSSDKTYRNHWYNHNGWHCEKCNNKLFKNPKWHPITNPKKISFKGKFVLLKDNPRKGICSFCYRKIGEGIKHTHMHHIHYHSDDVLKDAIELCVRCHRQVHSGKLILPKSITS